MRVVEINANLFINALLLKNNEQYLSYLYFKIPIIFCTSIPVVKRYGLL
jgi:hypothetical protein